MNALIYYIMLTHYTNIIFIITTIYNNYLISFQPSTPYDLITPHPFLYHTHIYIINKNITLPSKTYNK